MSVYDNPEVKANFQAKQDRFRGRPNVKQQVPHAGDKPLWDVKFDIEAVHGRVGDAGNELQLAAGKLDARNFGNAARNFERCLENELTRAVEEVWRKLYEDDREIVLNEICRAQTFKDYTRKRLETGLKQLNEMLASLEKIKIPEAPLAHRLAEGTKAGVSQVMDGAAGAGKRLARGARALGSFFV